MVGLPIRYLYLLCIALAVAHATADSQSVDVESTKDVEVDVTQHTIQPIDDTDESEEIEGRKFFGIKPRPPIYLLGQPKRPPPPPPRRPRPPHRPVPRPREPKGWFRSFLLSDDDDDHDDVDVEESANDGDESEEIEQRRVYIPRLPRLPPRRPRPPFRPVPRPREPKGWFRSSLSSDEEFNNEEVEDGDESMEIEERFYRPRPISPRPGRTFPSHLPPFNPGPYRPIQFRSFLFSNDDIDEHQDNGLFLSDDEEDVEDRFIFRPHYPQRRRRCPPQFLPFCKRWRWLIPFDRETTTAMPATTDIPAETSTGLPATSNQPNYTY